MKYMLIILLTLCCTVPNASAKYNEFVLLPHLVMYDDYGCDPTPYQWYELIPQYINVNHRDIYINALRNALGLGNCNEDKST